MTQSRLTLSVDDDLIAPEAAPAKTRILVVSAKPGMAEMIARSMAHDDTVESAAQKLALSDLAADDSFDVTGIDIVMFEVSPGQDAEIAALRTLTARFGDGVQFLGVTSETLSLAYAKQLMDAGVAEVMPLRIGRPELVDAQSLAPAADSAAQRRGGDVRDGIIVAATQTRGGIGTTSFVLNLAAMLTERKRRDTSEAPRVAVVDLDFQNGVLGASIDIEDNGGFIQFLKSQELADFDVITGLMQSYRDRFDVLAAPMELAPLDAMTPEMMASLLDELRLSYDYVLLDLPRAITRGLEAVLARADHLYVLSDLSVHSVRQARRLKDTFTDDHVSLPVEVLVALQKKPFSMPEAAREAEKFLDQKLRNWLSPDARAAGRATDKGEPLAMMAPKSVTARAMQPIVQDLRDLAAAETRRTA